MKTKKLLSLALATVMLLPFGANLSSTTGGALPILSASAQELGNGLEYDIIDGEVTIISFNSNVSEFEIPSEIEDCPVTTIGDSAFSGLINLTHIIIPDTVTSIHFAAFAECNNLTSVNIPDSVVFIDNYAFSDCKKLTDINVSENNTVYTSKNGILFSKDESEIYIYPAAKTNSEYVIPDSVTTIGNYAFADCGNLTSVTIPDSVNSIKQGAFENCTGLTFIKIPDILL